jgi:glutathione synthase/RimK-type ligase-like ATP-grasp enzyme
MSRGFPPRIRSRHPSHGVLRGKLPKVPFKSVIRFGSTTELIDAGVEINTTASIKNSASKIRMKGCFTKGKVMTAAWGLAAAVASIGSKVVEFRTDASGSKSIEFPLVGKSEFGSRGLGNTLIKSKSELESWMKGKELSHYILERFHNYNREYRLHVTKDGCFYACRKMLKDGTPDENRWFRNDSNSVWIIEDNPAFDQPVNWKTIESECVKALQSCGLDFGACDVRVQSTKDTEGKTRKNPDFIIVEINSAPSFGKITATKYATILPKLLIDKHKTQKK